VSEYPSHLPVSRMLVERARLSRDVDAYTFLRDGELDAVTLTWGELDTRARAIGQALAARGLVGERVVLLLPSGIEFLLAFYGCLHAGAVPVPLALPRSATPDELGRLARIMEDARPALLIGIREVIELARGLAGMPCALVETLELEGDAASWSAPALAPGDLAFLQYTSGSTTSPKGVAVSHAALSANVEAIIESGIGSGAAGQPICSWLPMHHDMGLTGYLLTPVYIAAHPIVMSPVHFLQQPVRWLRAMSRYRAISSAGPDFAYALCSRVVTEAEKRELDLGHWRQALNGADVVRAETMDRFARDFESCGFRSEAFTPCYGLAESTLFVSCKMGGAVATSVDADSLERGDVRVVAHGSPGSRAFVSCGGQRGADLAIVDPEARRRRGEDAIGEIWVSAPSVADGYFGQPDATGETFGVGLAGEGSARFLRTGDLGFLHEGDLYVTGRLKDVIILFGRNIHPEDVEDAVWRAALDPKVGRVVAFGAQSADGESLVVAASPSSQAVCTSERCVALAAAIREVVSSTCGLRARVVVVPPKSIPVTTSGKLRRGACRTALAAGDLVVLGQA
jgi:acyl-CoA synthetase (AMP-forming)/AMP-acid ligase II